MSLRPRRVLSQRGAQQLIALGEFHLYASTGQPSDPVPRAPRTRRCRPLLLGVVECRVVQEVEGGGKAVEDVAGAVEVAELLA